MQIIEIDDPADPRLADYRDLTDVALRRILEPAGGLYIAESAKVIARALAAGHQPRSVLVQSRWLREVEEVLGPVEVDVLSLEDLGDHVQAHIRANGRGAASGGLIRSTGEMLRSRRRGSERAHPNLARDRSTGDRLAIRRLERGRSAPQREPLALSSRLVAARRGWYGSKTKAISKRGPTRGRLG